MRISFGNRVIGTGLMALLTAVGLASAGDYSSWARYRTVTVNTSALALGANVTNFPLLARFNATDHADMLNNVATQILPGGADIRVTLADGTTDVPFEIEHASTGANGSLALWIKAPTVAQNSANAAAFRVFWGKAGAVTMSNPSAVFDTANGHLAVWHMNQPVTAAGDTIRDATAGKNHAVLGLSGAGAVAPVDTTGMIGIAKKIGASGTNNSVGSYFEVIDPDSSLNVGTDIGTYNLSAWVNVPSCGSGSRSAIISKYNNSGAAGTRQFALQVNGGGGSWNLTNNPTANAATVNEFNASTPCATNQWQHVSASYSSAGVPTADVAGATGTMKIYVNGGGAITYGVFTQATASIGRSSPVRISGIGDNIRFVGGSLDEVRMAKVVRDSDWVKLEYQTQRPTGGTAVTIGGTATPGMMDYSAWSGHRTITLNTTAAGANVPGNVTNFPVLIRLGANETGILSAANGGNSIRFSKADNATPLPYEIEHWSPTSAAIWVKVDTVKGNNATQTIRMHWGNAAAASESNGAAVFDSTGGNLGAWHLGNAAGTAARPNASGSGNPATPVNFPTSYTPVSGIIGMADTLRGGSQNAGDRLNLGNGFNNWNGTATLSMWVKPEILANTFYQFLSLSNGQAQDVIWLGRGGCCGSENRITAEVFNGSASGAWRLDSQADRLVNGQWQLIGFTVTDGDSVTIYHNGVPVANSISTQSLKDTTLTVNNIGRSPWPDPTLVGVVDEVRISKVSRSANWMKLEYENQKAVNALVDIGLPAAGPSKPYAAWTNRRAILLNTSATGANVSGTVTNFPVLIRLGALESAIIAGANNGNSIRFTKADSVTILPYQIESWSSTAAAIWVKVDTVRGNNATQTILMHWGNTAAADSSRGAAVFDTAQGYRAVFHMEQPTGNIVDATANAVVGTNEGTTTTANGLAGPARTFAGTNAANTSSTTDRQFINLGNPAALNFAGRITMSAWIRWTHLVGTENTTYYRTFINRDGSNPSAEVFLRIGHNAGNAEHAQYTTGKYTGSADIMAQSPQFASEYPDSAVWTHLAGVYDSTGPTNRVWRLYRNGVQIAISADAANAGVTGASTLWRLGRGPGTQNARWFVGDMDEVRIDAATRDSNYIKLSYENQRTLNTLVDIGNPAVTVPGAPASVTATASTTTTGSIVVSWTVPASNGNAPITAYNVTVASGTPNTATCATTGALTCTVTGLTPGNAYTFAVRATNSAGQGPAATSAAATAPTGILPGSFVIRMDGKTRPYAYRLPADVAAVTEELTMTIIDVHGKKVWSKTVNPAANNIRELAWDGTNTAGMKVSAGMYVVRINAVANGQSFESHGKGVLTP